MMDNIEQALSRKTWAVVGASNNKDKFGYKIFKFLDQMGRYKVYPVNPGLSEVMGHTCYSSVKDLPEKPDVVDVVVPQQAGEKVMRDCAEAGIENIWLQPGADSEPVIRLGRELGLNVICSCVMAEFRKRGLSE